jgi:putative ABC transport system permease protein
MLQNYILTAIRNITRNSVYSVINLAGLSLGIACVMLITLFVRHELSYDQFHTKKDRIYRVNYNFVIDDNSTISPSVPVFVGPYIKRNFPEVEDVTRFVPAYNPRTIRYNEKMFDEPGFCWVDSSFFDILDFKVLYGDISTALNRKGTIVITRSTARKYFNDESTALGKALLINNSANFEVTAVIEDTPSNSHFRFDLLTSIYNIDDLNEESIHWNNPNYTTFVLLKQGSDPSVLFQKIDAWVNPPSPEGNSTRRLTLELEPLNKVHFNTTVYNFGGQLAVTDMKYIYIFAAIGFLVLVTACINYVNLATARATTRAREVGMRKSVGASFRQLVFQYLAESAVLLLPAIVLATLACYLALPLLEGVLGKPINAQLFRVDMLAALAAAWMVLSLLAGLYPALILARFKPATVLRGKAIGVSGVVLRKTLVVVQFSVSIMMIASTLVVLSQLNYMQSKQLGMEKENLVIIRGNTDIHNKLGVFMNNVRTLPGVVSACGTWRSPFETVVGNGFNLAENPGDDGWVIVGGVAADHQYISTVGMELTAGSNFSETAARDTINEFIVNEAFLRDFGLNTDEAIGKKTSMGMLMDKGPGTIVGVVKDFHFSSLQHRIDPVVLFSRPDHIRAAIVRLKPGNYAQTLDAIEKEWRALSPNRPFNFTFLDDQYDALYRTEQRISALVTGFATIAIVIACLGLVGLASFNTVQRAKEISIRKALGATSQSIVFLLSKGYIRLMIVSFAVAVPLTAYLLGQWLEQFAYKISVGPMYYVFSFGVLVIVSFAAVGWQSWKAGAQNPVENLRSL